MESYLIFGIIALSIISVSIYLQGFKTIILIALLSAFMSAFFYSNEVNWSREAVEHGTAGYLKASLLGFSGLAGLIKFIFTKKENNFSISFIFLGCFLLLAFISVIYSIEPLTSLERASLFLFVVLFLIGLYKYLNTNDKFDKVIDILFISFSLFVSGCVISLLFPGRSWWAEGTSRFIGIGHQPNFTGNVLTLSFPFLLWKYDRVKSNSKRILIAFLGLVSVFLLLLTGSRTAIIALLIVIPLYLFLQKKFTKLLFLIMLMISLVMFILLFVNIDSTSISRGDEGTTTLTGREGIWNGALMAICERPVLGYGYLVENKIWATEKLAGLQEDWYNVSPQQPLHNGFLSVVIGNGLIGLALWIWLVFTPFVNLIKIRDNQSHNITKYKPLIFSVFTLIIVTNLSSSYLTGYATPGDIIFWIIWTATIRINERFKAYVMPQMEIEFPKLV